MPTARFENAHVNAQVEFIGDGRIRIVGKVLMADSYKMLELMAASPIDRGISYAGSGLPFPSPAFAFEGSKNYHVINPASGEFDVVFSYPNAYYSPDTMTKIPPSLFVTLTPRDGSDKIFVRFELPDELPLRTLTHRAERAVKGPEFYNKPVEIQTAEGVMRTVAANKAAQGYA